MLVCRPIITEPAEQVDNFVFEHRQVENVVLTKPREDPSKLYNIIKAIEVENSKLLKKLFQRPSCKDYDSKRATMRCFTRPNSSIRKSK